MRIAFLLEPLAPADSAPRINPVTAEVIGRLRERGARVDLIVPENGCVDLAELRPAHDLYVLKSKTPLALSYGGALAGAGAPAVNSFWSCTLVRDKIAAAALLAGAGIPVPPSWATGQAGNLLPLLAGGPLWLKSQRGSKGRGVHRVCDATALHDALGGATLWADPQGLPLPLFAQREVPSRGRDLKTYIVGDQIWAVEKPWPVRTPEDKAGRPAELPPRIREAALRCGRVLGLELYGVDFLVSEAGSFVVDVNAFPGFRGPAAVPRALAEYLYGRAAQARPRSAPAGAEAAVRTETGMETGDEAEASRCVRRGKDGLRPARPGAHAGRVRHPVRGPSAPDHRRP